MDGWMGNAEILVVRAIDLWNAVRVEVRADSFIIYIGPLHLLKSHVWSSTV